MRKFVTFINQPGSGSLLELIQQILFFSLVIGVYFSLYFLSLSYSKVIISFIIGGLIFLMIHYRWFVPYSRSIENENKGQFVEGFIKGFEEGFVKSGHKSDEVELVRNVPKSFILKYHKGSFFNDPEPDRDLFIDIRNHPGPYESYYDHGFVQGRLRGTTGKFYDTNDEEDKSDTFKYFLIPQEGEDTSDNLKYNLNPSELENISDGEYSYYDEDDGSLLIKNYKNGVQNGPSYYHYNSGELWIEENYLDGKIHGTTKYYNKDGSTKKEEIWEDGKHIK